VGGSPQERFPALPGLWEPMVKVSVPRLKTSMTSVAHIFLLGIKKWLKIGSYKIANSFINIFKDIVL
jgi:hypothetical protein